MKISSVCTALLVVGAASSGTVQAQTCPSGTTQVNNVSLISGRTMCAARSGERWQEWHAPGGQLWDYKRGPNSPTDPTEVVGSWTAVDGANGLLTHTYGSTSYSFRVCRSGPVGSNTFTLVSNTAGTITGVALTGVNGAPVPCP